MKAVVEGCRRLAIRTGLYIDLSRAVPQRKELYSDLVEILIPICKAYCTDMAFRVAETAVQSMGGYGYVKDFGVEQYLRDLKVACIFEGTSGIHAIDLQKRKLMIKEGRLFQNLIQEIEAFTRKNTDHPLLGDSVKKLERSKEAMVRAAASFPDKGKEDPGIPLSVAKPFLDLSGHLICTWMLLESAVTAAALMEGGQPLEKDRVFYQGKISTARFAAANLLPQADALATTIFEWDRSVIDMEAEGF